MYRPPLVFLRPPTSFGESARAANPPRVPTTGMSDNDSSRARNARNARSPHIQVSRSRELVLKSPSLRPFRSISERHSWKCYTAVTRILPNGGLFEIAADNLNQIVDARLSTLAFSHVMPDVIFHELRHQAVGRAADGSQALQHVRAWSVFI